MIGHYVNTPAIWPMLATASALLGLAVYAWRRRAVPGAQPLAVTLGLAVPWALGAVLEAAAADIPTRVFWFRFQALWPVASATAGLWFALEYASLDRYLTGRVMWLLVLPPLAGAALVLTDPMHHLLWRSLSFNGHIRVDMGPAAAVFLSVGFAVAMASSLVFLWLFVQSPLHRWPAALCLCGQIAARLGFALEAADANPLAPVDIGVVGTSVLAVMYAVAVFRFGMFTVVPVARSTVVEHMGEGMLILDQREAILDMNPAAERILGVAAKQARGRRLRDLLPTTDAVLESPRVTTGSGQTARSYAVRISPLENRRGFRLGSLVLLQDVTEQQRAQAQLVEQQRALATLRERDRVARELHDSLGQVMGFLKMQAHTARLLLARGQVSEVDGHLAGMLAAAQDAHADVREYILGSSDGGADGRALLASLQRYLVRFGETCGIVSTLDIQAGLRDDDFDPMVAAQLLRIVQEALTNVRKHAGASRVRVGVGTSDTRAEVVVADDGRGIESTRGHGGSGATFGLQFMRERAEDVGGSVRVQSAPGGGTEVLVSVPLRQGRS